MQFYLFNLLINKRIITKSITYFLTVTKTIVVLLQILITKIINGFFI